jgi:Asp-tRNA(Asn)/Glu-tRNA(Gln) amidotransferase A subunit family amidase
MNSDIHIQDISGLNSSLVENKISFQDILASCYGKIQSNEDVIRAWKYIIPAERQLPPNVFGPLFGLCLGVKDIFATIDAPTKMGTDDLTWRGTQGSFDARIISKIRSAGATIIGKNKTAEFAVHEPTDTTNPRNEKLTPGTSSSGGAAAVAAGHVSVSISSQTAGSIARPSSYCGVIGFKPTFGELPRTGVLKTTETFDTIGLIGNSISNISAVFNVARVHDLNHPLHLKRSTNNFENVRVLHAIGPTFDSASDTTRQAAITLASSLLGGINLLDLASESTLDFKNLRICHEDIYAKELAYFLKDELRSENISRGLRAFGEYGADLPIEIYRERVSFLNIQRRLSDLDLHNSIIFALSAAAEAPLIGENDLLDANLLWTSLGLPQISLPLLNSESGNPIGISIIGFRGSDNHLLNLAQSIFPNRINQNPEITH